MKNVADLPHVLHEAFRIATTGRPGPVVVDIPKDIQFATGLYVGPGQARASHNYHPRTEGDPAKIAEAAALIAGARRPIFYTGGGVINAGPEASRLLREFAALTRAPVTSTLMGLGVAFPASAIQHGPPAWSACTSALGSQPRHARLRRDGGDPDRASTTASPVGLDAFSTRLEEDPHRHRPLVDRQGGAHRHRHRGRRGPGAGGADRLVETPAPGAQRRGAEGLVGADRHLARPQGLRLSAFVRADQAAARDRAALRADPRPRRLHHHRGRPAPDVGGAVLPLRGTEPLDDLRRARHHGLRPAGGRGSAGGASRQPGHRHRRRRLGADDDAGGLDRHSVQPADQGVHPQQQPMDGHGAAAVGSSCCTASATATRCTRTACQTSSSWPRPMGRSACAPITRASSTPRSSR